MKNINIMKNIHSFIKSNCGIGGISSVSRRFLVLLITLLSLGVGNAWATDRIVFFQANDNWLAASAKPMIHYWQSDYDRNNGDQEMVLSNNDKLYYAFIPDWADRVQFYRKSGNNEWNRTGNLTLERWYGQGNINDDCTFKNWSNTVFWNTYTVYYDDTESALGSPKFRIGYTKRTGTSKDYANAYNMELVKGTKSLYKYTRTGSNWDNYDAFSIANNVGGTGDNYSIYHRGSGDYLISKQTKSIYGSLMGNFTIIGRSSGAYNGTGADASCTYYPVEIFYGCKRYTITNTEVAHATVELYYRDEDNNLITVSEGNSANVLPTTKVWCKVTPDEGYALNKVNLFDPSEREWTDAAESSKGLNCYVVRTNVTFTAVVEPLVVKTVLIKDVNSWEAMYIKGWNPFLYEGNPTSDDHTYHITTQKLTETVSICDETYYIASISNEFPFYYIHNKNDASRTAFIKPDRLTHMQKYDNYTSGDSNWGLRTTDCTNAIYWVETTTGSGKKYISNIVSGTDETMSFYAAFGSTVDFHAGGSAPVNVYSTSIAPFFGSGQELDGKSGSVFTAKTNGSGLTDVAVYDGDYHIHVNATTRNYLSGGESKPGTNGTRFVKFNKSSIFRDTYDYYWVDWFLGSGDSYGKQSVVATVGNEYNANLAGVLGADSYAPEGMTENAGGNVRYGYDPETNFFERAIVSGGGSDIKIKGNASGEIMVLNGSDYTDDAYDAARSFSDASNWNYQIKAKVKGGKTADVTTTYNGKAQTLADNKKLIQGIENTQYTVEITYDFRTNRIIAAWTPDGGDIATTFDLQANMLVERVEDGEPTVLNITNNDALLTNVTQIYTAMKFTHDHWDDASRTITSGVYTDAYYWISLPYDCNVGDIFGIPGYGDAWVIQTYHGDYRAQQGWWAETDSWWYDMDLTGKMEANRGYVIRLTNLEAAGKPFNSGDITEIRLYFPSARTDVQVGVLNNSSITTTIAPLTCEKWNQISADAAGVANHGAGNPRYDRRAIDSNWNLIGSPSFNTAKITTDGWETTNPYPTEQNAEGTPLK